MAREGLRAPPAWSWAFPIVAVAIGYPFAVQAALQRFGVRPVAAAALILAVPILAVALFRWREGGRGRETAGLQLLTAALGMLALATGKRWPLLLVPGVIQAGLGWLFLNSLHEPACIALRIARWMQPALPAWVDGYCRKLTLAWALFFAANALAIGWLALTGPREVWLTYTGSGLWLAIVMLQIAELLLRKSWFRYYDGTLLDRVLRPIFPPENTARGRRSMAYIQHMRRELDGET